jgi:septation ring formation regulator EzrA
LERYKQQVASFKTKKSLDNLEARLTAMEQRLDFMLEKIEKLIKDFNV